MTRTTLVLAGTLVVLGGYLGAVLFRSLVLAADGGAVALVLAVGLVVLVAVAGWAIVAELRFGFATLRLGRRLAAEGGLPVDDLPRTPGGRVDREQADEHFDRYRAEVEQNPEDWRVWYRLAWAYDAAGDRRRGRRAARQAVRLSRSDDSGG